jgi:hypothetical protein
MAEIAGRNRDVERALEFAANAYRIDPDDDVARELLLRLESTIRERDSENDAEEKTVSF